MYMKIVVDTNSIIDGSSDEYNFGNRIIDEVIAGNLVAYANKATLAENRLMAGKKVTDEKYLAKLDHYFSTVNLIETKQKLNVVEDSDDNKILESAIESEAKFLITSDNHLLKLGQYHDVKIITPSGFWQSFEEESGAGWKKWLGNFIK